MTDEPPDTPEGLSPEGAFAVLGNETRLGVLLALWEAYDPRGGAATVSFSELRERVGVADSGQFNYHLDQLTDRFVRRAEGGYELSQAGLHIVQAVIAGTGTSAGTLDSTEVNAACPLCEAPITVRVAHELVEAHCTQCDGVWSDDGSSGLLFRFLLPPAGLESRTATEVFHASVTFNFHRLAAFRRGVCPHCSGTVERTLDVCRDHDAGMAPCSACDRRHLSEVTHVCTSCKASVRDPVVMAALMHPAVVALYYNHGVALWFDAWEAFGRGQRFQETLVSTDPLHVRITATCEGEELHLTLDDELEVVEVGK